MWVSRLNLRDVFTKDEPSPSMADPKQHGDMCTSMDRLTIVNSGLRRLHTLTRRRKFIGPLVWRRTKKKFRKHLTDNLSLKRIEKVLGAIGMDLNQNSVLVIKNACFHLYLRKNAFFKLRNDSIASN